MTHSSPQTDSKITEPVAPSHSLQQGVKQPVLIATLRELLIATLAATIGGIFVLAGSEVLTGWGQQDKLYQINKHNLFVACKIQSDLKQYEGSSAIPYDTLIYKENLDFISRQEQGKQDDLQSAMAAMDLANNFTMVGIAQPGSQKEMRDKQEQMSSQIIGDITQYDQRLSSGCKLFRGLS